MEGKRATARRERGQQGKAHRQNEKIILYREEFLDAGSVKTVDDSGRTLLIHYWNSHTVPLDHMERCMVLNA